MLIEKFLDLLVEKAQDSVDFMDCRVIERNRNLISRADGQSENIASYFTKGIGIRTLYNGAWGFSATSILDEKGLFACLEASIDSAKNMALRLGPGAQKIEIAKVEPVKGEWSSTFKIHPSSVSLKKKAETCKLHEDAIKKVSPQKIISTRFTYEDIEHRERVYNTYGTKTLSTRVLTRIGANAIASDGKVSHYGNERKMGLEGYELIDDISPEDFGSKASEEAIMMLGAKNPPAGKFPVIFHPITAALLIHEALGHNAEGDHVATDSSIFKNKLGTKIGADCLNVEDDPTVQKKWGSFKYDSEGVPAQKVQIIKNGVLTSFMNNLESAHSLNLSPNGSARVMDYRYPPIVRMSNTNILAGDSTLDDLLSGIEYGILAEGGNWGYVMCESGNFTTNVTRSYAIRNGKKCELLQNVTISGSLIDALMNIEGLGNEFIYEEGGMCGKAGQFVPVAGGGAYVRVKELVVGGQT